MSGIKVTAPADEYSVTYSVVSDPQNTQPVNESHGLPPIAEGDKKVDFNSGLVTGYIKADSIDFCLNVGVRSGPKSSLLSLGNYYGSLMTGLEIQLNVENFRGSLRIYFKNQGVWLQSDLTEHSFNEKIASL
ncbi:hypothetical protein PENCOP_c002G00651 [Penicillium coprophilum]|uniref:Uncharacterized protein n=1 Tax=Penicillium coprophilum TaxID=36646 RepID=A0A1V6V1H5_9EURO|nr:hypothetical protein PENCOP_c002G00651 [Penicillium coprophilum]